MATRPKRSERNIVADGRHAAAAARRHHAEFQEFDKRRERKLLPEERLARFERHIDELDAATGGQTTGRALQAKATDTEEERRAALHDAVVGVRDEIKVSYPDDRAIGRAFGVGLALSAHSTPQLLQAGQAILSSWQDPTLRPVAERAGIDEARMNELARLVAALGAADTTQNAAVTQGHGQTLTKAELVREVSRETAYVRKVARVVFRKDAAVRAEFASTLPRRTVQPRSAPAESAK